MEKTLGHSFCCEASLMCPVRPLCLTPAGSDHDSADVTQSDLFICWVIWSVRVPVAGAAMWRDKDFTKCYHCNLNTEPSHSSSAEGEIIFIKLASQQQQQDACWVTEQKTNNAPLKWADGHEGGGGEGDDTCSLAQRTSATWGHMVRIHHGDTSNRRRGAEWSWLVWFKALNGAICGAPGRRSERTEMKVLSQSLILFSYWDSIISAAGLHRYQLSVKQRGRDSDLSDAVWVSAALSFLQLNIVSNNRLLQTFFK